MAAAFFFQPSFKVADREFQAGKAVVVKVPGAPGGLMVLSCMHILGPAGGMPRQLESADLPKSLQQIKLIDIHGKETAIGPALAVPGAKPFALPDASTDISAFTAPAFLAISARSSSRPRSPASATASGCWRESSAARRPPRFSTTRTSGAPTTSCWVTSSTTTALNLTATSGAAVLNARGQVVGLNLGGGLVGKKLIVFANPITSVRKKIELALVAAK